MAEQRSDSAALADKAAVLAQQCRADAKRVSYSGDTATAAAKHRLYEAADTLDALVHLMRQENFERIERQLQALLAEAEACGLVITVEQQPLQPLRMGYYRTVGTVRRARSG